MPTLSPDLAAPDGTLAPDPDVKWVVATDGVEVVGKRAADPRGGLTLFRIRAAAAAALRPDGRLPGRLDGRECRLLTVRRRRGDDPWLCDDRPLEGGWKGKDVPGKVTIKVGPDGRARQPARPAVSRRRAIHDGISLGRGRNGSWFAARAPFRVEVSISPTFSPAELDPTQGDVRELGARVGFGFIPLP